MDHVYEVIQTSDRKVVMTITAPWRRVERVIYALNSSGYQVVAKRQDKTAPVQMELEEVQYLSF